jgi:hypothetical protein
MYKYQQRKLSEIPTEPDLDTLEFKSFYVTNTRSGGHIIVQARNKDEAYHVAVRENPEWSIGDLDVSERSAPPQTQEESRYTGYRVTGSNSSEEIIAARSPGEAERIAILLYPNLGDNLNVSATNMSSGLAAARYMRHQEDLARVNSSTNNTRISDFRTYTVTNNETGQARRFAATSQEDAIAIGRREYPALFNILNVTATRSS